MFKDGEREKIIKFLEWNDRNGIYSDEDMILHGHYPLTDKEMLKFFYDVVSKGLYDNYTDNIFELTFEKIQEIAQEKCMLEIINEKLQVLLCSNGTETFYRSLL